LTNSSFWGGLRLRETEPENKEAGIFMSTGIIVGIVVAVIVVGAIVFGAQFLVGDVMTERGYPAGQHDQDQVLADLS